jgi:hypothetical protein
MSWLPFLVAGLGTVSWVLPSIGSKAAPSQRRLADSSTEPWVLHGPLDGRLRMITVALDPGVFAAYDASTCTFVCAWAGGISFKSEASAVPAIPLASRQGPIQSVGRDGAAWEVCQGDSLLRSTTRYRGCSFDEGKVTLLFDIATAAGTVIRVEETPHLLTSTEMDELWRAWTHENWPEPREKDAVLCRSFRVRDLPSDHRLTLRYSRTVAAMTWWPGFDGKRDPRSPGHTTPDGIRVEPLLLSFADGPSAQTIELMERP